MPWSIFNSNIALGDYNKLYFAWKHIIRFKNKNAREISGIIPSVNTRAKKVRFPIQDYTVFITNTNMISFSLKKVKISLKTTYRKSRLRILDF